MLGVWDAYLIDQKDVEYETKTNYQYGEEKYNFEESFKYFGEHDNENAKEVESMIRENNMQWLAWIRRVLREEEYFTFACRARDWTRQ